MADPTVELISALRERRMTIAVAESLTGGLVTAELTRPAGASAVVLGAIVAYATEIKHSLLGVGTGLLAVHGPVHQDVAMHLAASVRSRLSVGGVPASVGVSTTGVAGPDTQGGREPGTVFIGISTDAGSRFIPLQLTGDRETIRQRVVSEVITALRVELRLE